MLKFYSAAVGGPWRSIFIFLKGRRVLVFKVVLLWLYCIASPYFSTLLLGALFALMFPSVSLMIAFWVSIGRFFSSTTIWLSLFVLVGLLYLGFWAPVSCPSRFKPSVTSLRPVSYEVINANGYDISCPLGYEVCGSWWIFPTAEMAEARRFLTPTVEGFGLEERGRTGEP